MSKYGKRIFVDVLEMPESDVVVHSKDQDIQDWSKVALQIKEHYENYHGFVILHGTDTMAYLASALSFMFENLAKSVIFTGSQVRLGKVLAPSQIAFSRENRGTDAGVLLLMAYAGRLRPTWLLTFFRLQVYGRVGKSVISVGKKAQNG